MAKKSTRKVVVDSPLASDDDKDSAEKYSQLIEDIAKELKLPPQRVAQYQSIIKKIERGLYSQSLGQEFIQQKESS
jgi:hypothetical protein